MKKRLFKRLAFALALTVAVTSVDAPSAAAAKPGFMSTKAVVKVGQTKKYRTKNNSKYSTRFVIGNKKVATVKYSRSKKFAKVTGVKPGKTTLRVDFKNYVTKKVTPVRIKVYVKAAGVTAGEITVSTQAELEAALKSGKYGKIVIKTDAGAELTVPAGDYKKVDLVIDAPNANVTNKGQFHEVILKGKAVQYTENGRDNVIRILADEADFKIAENTKVEKVVFEGKKIKTQMGAGSKIASVVNETEENIVITTPGGVETIPAGTEDKTIETEAGTSGSGSGSGNVGGGNGSGNGNGNGNGNGSGGSDTGSDKSDITSIKNPGDKNYVGGQGDTIELPLTVEPTNATTKPTWGTDNAEVAVVDENGNVTITGSGKTTITATATDKNGNVIEETYDVFGKKDSSESGSISIDGEKQISLKTDGKQTLSVTNSGGKKITWFSSNKDVATVDENGVVTAKGEGTAIITGITEDGDYVEYFVDVTAKKASLEKDGAAAPSGGTNEATFYKVNDEEGKDIGSVEAATFAIDYTDKDGNKKTFEGNYSELLEKSNTSEDSVKDKGSLVLPVGWKDVNIRVTTEGGKSYNVEIPEVTKQEVVDIAVKILGNGNIICRKETTLMANVSNLTGANPVTPQAISYKWESDDASIASVKGSEDKAEVKIEGKAPGTTKIMVTVEGAGEYSGKIPEKKTAEITITVKNNYEITFEVSPENYKVGDIVTLTAKVLKNGEEVTDTSDMTYRWAYPNNAVAYKLQYKGTFQNLLEEKGKNSVEVIVLDKDAISVLGISGSSLEQPIAKWFEFKPEAEKNYPDITVELAPKMKTNAGFMGAHNRNLDKASLKYIADTDNSKDGVITANLIIKGKGGIKNLETYGVYGGKEQHKYVALRISTGETELKKVVIRRKDTDNFKNNFVVEETWDEEKLKTHANIKGYMVENKPGDIIYWLDTDFFTSHWVSHTWFEIAVNDKTRVHINLIMGTEE